MNTIIQILSAFVTLCLMLGLGEVVVKATYRMATRAEHAFQHDQLSYEKFTRAMTEAKPRKPHRHHDQPVGHSQH